MATPNLDNVYDAASQVKDILYQIEATLDDVVYSEIKNEKKLAEIINTFHEKLVKLFDDKFVDNMYKHIKTE